MKVLKLVIVVLCICIFPSKINAQNRVCIDDLLLFDLDTVNYVATFSGISPFAPEGDLGVISVPEKITVRKILYAPEKGEQGEANFVVNKIDFGGQSGWNSISGLKIPSTVIHIGPTFPGYQSHIESLELPESIVEIGDDAFNDWENLKSIKMSSNIVAVGKNAFRNCHSLEFGNLPKKVQTMGEKAFYGCDLLTSIDLSHMTSIPTGAFDYCVGLTDVKLSENLVEIGEDAFDHSAIKELTLPDGILKLGKGAFWSCKNLFKINLPESLVNIGNACFGNTGLKEIIWPSQIENIGASMFWGSSIERINIPNTVKSIGEGAFSFSSLNELVLSDESKLESIGEKAFEEAADLQTLRLPEGVVSIPKRAFYWCKLSTIELPASIQYIGEQAFYRNPRIKRLVLKGVPVIEDDAFQNTTIAKAFLLHNAKIKVSPQNTFVASAVPLETVEGQTIYVPGGVKQKYEKLGCSNVKEMYSYFFQVKGENIQVMLHGNIEGIAFNKVNINGVDAINDGGIWQISTSSVKSRVSNIPLVVTVSYTVDDQEFTTEYSSEVNNEILTNIPTVNAGVAVKGKLYSISGQQVTNVGCRGIVIEKKNDGSVRKYVRK